MIRFLLALLIIHFSFFSLLSCTSQNTSGSPSADGAISDSDLAENPDGSAATTPSPDGLDGDLEKADGSTVTDKPSEDNLENELSANDSKDQKVAQNEKPVESQEIAPEPPPADQQLQPEPPQAAEPAPPPPPAEVTPPPQPEAPPIEKPEAAKVRDIRYLANSAGGTVVIETSKPVTYQTRMNRATQQFVIEMADVELPASLQRPYQTKEMGSRIGGINAYQGEGSKTARVVIQLASDTSGEPVIQQEGTSLVVIPPAAPAPAPIAAATPAPEASTGKSQSVLAAQSLDEFLTGNQKFFGHVVNLQVKDADVRDVINFLAEESGANIVMGEDVAGKVSLKLRKIPWDQALVTVMRSKSLGYTRQGNVLRISSLKTLQDETEVANKIIEAQKAIVPLEVRVIPASYANVDDLVKSVTPFLSKDGKVVADNRSNTLIVTDKGEVTERVDKLVKTLDVMPPQVSIESKIVEAVEGFENFVGINWRIAGAPISIAPSGGHNGAPVNLNLGANSATLNPDVSGGSPLSASLGIGTLDVLGDLSATLTLAETDSLAKVISAPRISTMNREKSTIVQQGENVSVVTTRSDTTGATTKTEKRTPFTLQLDVTPQITVDGSVIMDLEVQRQFLGPVLDNETKSQAVNTRRAKTKILVRNGQTAVIGGIYTSDETQAVNGVPGLMNIPVLGWLFKNKSVSRSKNELLIFMTPRILSADGTTGDTGGPASSLIK